MGRWPENDAMTTVVREAPRVDRLDPARAAYRTLLVHVQPDAAAEPRLKAAVELAGRLEATLFGVAAEMIPSIAVSDPYGLMAGEFLAPLQAQIDSNLKAAETLFRRQAQGVAAEWCAVQDEPTQALARLSRAADLIVAGGSPLNYRDGNRWCDPAALMLVSGRPVLVAPPQGGSLSTSAVVVAWKDTREARRALADAVPFLQCAEEVLVLEVCGASETSDAEARTDSVVEGLKRHGVAARGSVKAASADAVAFELNLAAAGVGADLIVAGGYGHSRLGEWAFGGVTRDLLMHPERFVLLSH